MPTNHGEINSSTSMLTAAETKYFGNHMWPFYVSGQNYVISNNGIANSSIAGAADRLDVSPFVLGADLTVDQIGIEVTVAVALSTARIVVYAADPTTGQPTTKLGESGALDCGSTGVKSWTTSRTFTAGVPYWLGVHYSSTQTLRGIPLSALITIAKSTGTINFSAYRRSVAYGSASPDPFGTGTLTSTIMPVILLRAA